ncbi:MAG: hypothetical protein ABJB01_08445 [Rudaea sp.]
MASARNRICSVVRPFWNGQKSRLRSGWILEGKLHARERTSRGRVAGLRRERLRNGRHGSRQITLDLTSQPHIQPAAGVVRVDGNDAARQLGGFARASAGQQRGGVVVPEHRATAVFRGALEPRQRLVASTRRMQRNAEHVLGIGMRTESRQQIAIGGLGGGQTPRCCSESAACNAAWTGVIRREWSAERAW